MSATLMTMRFTQNKQFPENPHRFIHSQLKQSEHVAILTRSKIAIYTQGILGCITSKFALSMTLGVAVAGNPLENNPELLAAYPHLRAQFRYTEPDELIDYAKHLGKSSRIECA